MFRSRDDTLIGAAPWREQRARPRLPVRLEAKVLPGRVDCLITDLSLEGARLEFTAAPPAATRLIIVECETGRAHEALAAWRQPLVLGVKLLRSVPLQGAVPAAFAEAEALWLATGEGAQAATTLSLARSGNQWAVVVSGAALAQPGELIRFPRRWEAQRFACNQARTLREQGVKAVCAHCLAGL